MKTQRKILVVDDEEAIRSFISMVLKTEGYEVVTASDASEGIKKTFSEIPDVVLTDIRMPGLDGISLIRRVRATIPPAKLPIIVISAFGDEVNIADAIKAGATDYIVKPFDFNDLLARIDIALGKVINPMAIQSAEHRDIQSADVEIRPGSLIDNGKYEIIGEIGSGGMGTVYTAEHVGYGSEMAIKILNPEFASNREYVLRFLREMKIAIQMDHPGIVKVFDIGTNSDVYYYSMESLPRNTMEDEVGRKGPFPESRVVSAGLNISSALAYMHRRGYIHRDVKPGNVIVCSENEFKLIDFGLACAIDDQRLTKAGSFMGTPGFVAPENIVEYRNPTASCDIYSLGATLYFAASGVHPYGQANRQTSRLIAQVEIDIIPLSEINNAISRNSSDIIAKMMSRDPKARYSSMDEVYTKLNSLGLGHENGTSR